MDPFERYQFNLMISHEPLAANGNNFGEWFHAFMEVLRNANMDLFVSHMPGDEVHEGPHHQCEVCIVKDLRHTCIDAELVERCHIPLFGSQKNTVVREPKIRDNKNFLKCLTNDCVSLLIILFDPMLVIV